MNNEKFCFSKTAGLMVLVGSVLVVGAYFMGSLSNKSTSTSTRASTGSRYCAYGENQFADPSDSLKLGSVTYTIDGRGCVLADGVIKDSARCSIVAGDFTNSPAKVDTAACPVPDVSPECMYGEKKVTNSTYPYRWVAVRGTAGELKGKPIKCIADFNTGIYTGARCITDDSGKISDFNSALDDESRANCPVPVICKGSCVGENGKTYDIGAIEFRTFAERQDVREAVVCQCSPNMSYPTWKTDTGPGSKLP